jgi:type VI secretion-associated protein, BMA_A0400 family
VGVYGKIPAQRDFVRINAGAFLRAGLDLWLQDGVEHLQGLQLPDEPTCFLLSPAAGTQSFVGALAPGTDALGRAFPVVIFAALDQPPRADFSLLPLQRACFFAASVRLARTAHALDLAQLVAEIDALASGLRLAVRVPDVNALLARSNGSDLGAAVGGLPGAPAYALFTLMAACSQSKAPDSSARVLVLDCPAPSDELRTFWLELVRRHLPEQMPSFFWTRESGRLLIALGPPPSLMLAYLADPEHKGSRRWSLRTLDPSARLNALEKLSPGQGRVLAPGDASLADVLQAFA